MKGRELPMYEKLKYFLGGAIATLGVVVTITDPETLENVLTFPDRLSSHFKDDEASQVDLVAAKIILEARLSRVFEEKLDLPDASKDKLAAHFADKCTAGIADTASFGNDFSFVGSRAVIREPMDRGATFETVSGNIATSIKSLPVLTTGCSYYAGVVLGQMGPLEYRDFVEKPSSVPLQNGAIRLVAGGGLFALPIVYEAMQTTVGDGSQPSGIIIDSVGASFDLNN